MNEPRIWTEAELVAFTHHPEDDLRAWAWRRLALHHEDAAGRGALRGLCDLSWRVIGGALHALARRPSPEATNELRKLQYRRDLPLSVTKRAARLFRGEPEPIPPQRAISSCRFCKGEREPIDERELAVQRLAASPEDLRRDAPAALASADDEERLATLRALERQPYRWATMAVLDRLEGLLTTAQYADAWDALAALGDPRALAAVVAEWQPGEGRIASTALRLHRLAGSPEPLPPGLLGDAKAHARQHHLHAHLRLSRGMLRPEIGPLLLDLQCTDCRRAFTYDVQSAALHPEPDECDREGWDGITLGRVIVCKRCGAEDSYELTSLAMRTLSLRFVIATRGGTCDPELEGPLVMARPELWNGTMVRRPSHAIRQLRALAEQHPERAEGWRQLGNLLERLGQRDEAVAAWTRAAEDPEEMEACSSLAGHHQDQGRLDEAFDLATRTIERLRGARGDQPAKIRRAAAETAVGILRGALPRSTEPLTLTASWLVDGARRKLAAVGLSSVDLRGVRRWDRLVDFLAGDALVSARLTAVLPEEEDTTLAQLLQSSAPLPGLARRRAGASGRGKVVRNEPCPCGSGKAAKRCCGP